MNKNILIITYSMIPYAGTWGGCQRMFYLANQLLADEYDVTVASCKTGNENYFGKEIKFKALALPVTRNKIAKQYIHSKNNNQQFSTSKKKSSTGIKSVIKNNDIIKKSLSMLDRIMFNEPGLMTGFVAKEWCKENKSTILDYIKNNNIGTVIISGPPFGMFSIVQSIKKEVRSLNVIVDYRDPWNLWKKGSMYTYYKEKRTLELADKITCTNDGILNAFVEKFDIDKQKICVVANGFNENDWRNIKEERINNIGTRTSFTLTYTGAITLSRGGYRDISNLLFAIRDLNNDRYKITIQLIGVKLNNSEYENNMISMMGDSLVLVPPVNNSEAIAYIYNSDVSLLVHTPEDNSGRYIVSGKLYDYLRCKKPVLSIGIKDGAHAILLQQLHIGENCENNTEEIKNTIKKMYLAWENQILDKTYSYNFDISQYSRYNQNKIMERIINEQKECL